MGVAFQERAFEGYMNVAIDNYLREYHGFLILDVPSPSKEGTSYPNKISGYDMSYGDILFIQYKSIYHNAQLKKYTRIFGANQYKDLLKGVNLCSVFYVFPYAHEFIEIRKDYFFTKAVINMEQLYYRMLYLFL